VITNVRADHLDVMGPTVMDVARALSNTIPLKGKFFTAERDKPLKILKQNLRPGVEMTVTDPATVTDEEIAGFSYIEHKENVALALAVCESLGVDRKTALRGMHRSLPDSGVMRIYRIVDRGKELELVNTLAANDPDSISMLWRMVKERNRRRIVLVNCRRDRADRSRQLAELIRDWDYDYAVVTGGLTRVFIQRAIQVGIPKEKLKDFGEEIEPALVYDGVWALIEGSALIFATGNTVGYGEKLINCFVSRGAAG
jgi:poly-gamma-glutamate synthase PgsB/CapB